jgi:hypothetical protein
MAVLKISLKSNLPALTGFFTKIVEEHAKNKNSAFRTKRVHYRLSLLNYAATFDEKGRAYRYYPVADRGRKQIIPSGGRKAVTFTVKSSNVIFAAKSPKDGKRAKTYNITAKSLANINSVFPAEIDNQYKKFLSSPKSGSKGLTRGTSKVIVIDKDSESNLVSLAKGTATKRTVQNVVSSTRAGQGGIDAQKIVSAASNHARNIARTYNVPFRAPSLSSDPFLQALIYATNWATLGAIFVGVVGDQAEIFRANTPKRKTFKLLADGTVVNPPGGELKDSYALKTNRELSQLIK